MLPGPIPEHPVLASRSDQDSYVSKGGPLNDLDETNFQYAEVP